MFEHLRFPAGWPGVVWSGYGVSNRQAPQASHHHDALESNIVLSGSMTYMVGGHRLEVKHGSLLWLLPGHEHTLIGNTRDFRVWVCLWSPELFHRPEYARLLAQLAASKIAGAALQRISRRWLQALAAACSLLAGGGPTDPRHPGLVTGDQRAVVTGLAWLLEVHRAAWDEPSLEPAAQDASAQALHPAVQTALAALRAGGGRAGLDSLARTAGLSATRLSHLIRRQTGLTLPGWRNRFRLERANELLQNGRLELRDIALESGFGSYSQFHRIYVQAYGRGPRRHRLETVTVPGLPG
jgi:AraC-like DNA-binding protein